MLLATDRKYGSLARRARVREYHRWSSGLVVDTANSGSPSITASVPSSQTAGASADGSVRGTAIGRVKITAPSRTM